MSDSCQHDDCNRPATHAEPLPGSYVVKCGAHAVDGAIPLPITVKADE